MAKSVVTTLIRFSALGCGLLAGLYFAFSTFIMTALARLGPGQGIAAMNSINVTILRSLFMPFFVGTTLSSLVLAVIGIMRWGEPPAGQMVAGGLIYVLGMFVVTMLCNVPRNNELVAVDPTDGKAAPVWARYLKEWTFWNHVRTVSCVVATALFVAALAAE